MPNGYLGAIQGGDSILTDPVSEARVKLAQAVAAGAAAPTAAAPTAPAPGGVAVLGDAAIGGGGVEQPRDTPQPQVQDGGLEAARQDLRDKKREANNSWLVKVGRGVCALAIIVGVGSVWFTYSQNQQPAVLDFDSSSQQINAQVATIQTVASGLESPYSPDDLSKLDDSLAATLPLTEAAMKTLGSVPDRWNGRSLTDQRSEGSDVLTKFSTRVAELRTVLASSAVTPEVLRGSLGDIESEARNMQNVRFPWITEPWKLNNQVAAGFLNAIMATVLLVLILFVLLRANGGIRSLLIDGDGRFSTSQTQAALWSIAVYFLIAHLSLRSIPGNFSELNENYLLLLGGPYAAWVVSGAVSRAKLDAQTLQKVSAPEAQLRDLVSDDNGRASLTDVQFFGFSVLALIGVLVAFGRNPAGLPPIPPGLALLTGAAALVYTGKKALDVNAPVVYSVNRREGEGPIVAETGIVIAGANFVPPGAAGDLDVLTGLVVRFKTASIDMTKPVLQPLDQSTVHSMSTPQKARNAIVNPSNTRVETFIPVNLPSGPLSISVITAAGVESNAVPLIVADTIQITGIQQLDAQTLRIEGRGFTSPGGGRNVERVEVGSSTAVPFVWTDDRTLTATMPSGLSGDTVVSIFGVLGSSTQTFSPF